MNGLLDGLLNIVHWFVWHNSFAWHKCEDHRRDP